MNTFKQNLATFILVLFSVSVFAQQAEKTLVKSFNIDATQEVTLDLPGTVEVKHWNNKVMRIQMTISIENGSDPMLKSLVSAGRYNINAVTENGEYRVEAPNMAREIKLKGQPLKEKIAYTVFTPERISVTLADETSTSTEEDSDDASL